MSKRNRAIRERVSRESSPPAGAAGARFTTVVLAIALVLVAISFANGIGGRFVYDDEKQIAGNALIQDSRLLGKALTSDVWAFKGDETKTWSNYWRPVFIAWLALQYRLFGTDTVPWHVLSIGLHGLATVLAYFAMKAAGARPEAAAIGTFVFAAHPAHVESVTWISGSADPMVAIFLFGAFLCHLSARRGGGILWWAGGCVLFAGGLLCKEITIVFPAIVFLTELAAPPGQGESPAARLRTAVRGCAPYIAVAAAYFAVRIGIIGMKHLMAPGGPGLAGVVLSAPEVLVFYLRHALLPLGLGPTYPLRPVTPANVGFVNFVVPALLSAAACWGAYALARRSSAYRVGLIWFFLPLAPVFDLRSFISEDFVHDRYLYLPLFGIALIAGSFALELWERGGASPRAAVWAIGVPVGLVLMLSTRSYNPVWMDGIALWERGVWSNPDTAFPHAQLGETYRGANRLAEARRELERALELNPRLTHAHVGLAAVAVQENRLDEAERHLQLVLTEYPDFTPGLEQLALVYQKQGKLAEAVTIFERARSKVPLRHATYTVNIAVLHRMLNRSDQALSDLEGIRDRLDGETAHEALRGWWFLGELYREKGERDQAVAAYRKYLSATAGRTEPEVVTLRKIVADTLAKVTAAGASS